MIKKSNRKMSIRQEKEILKDYLNENFYIEKICEYYNINVRLLYEILKKYKIKLRGMRINKLGKKNPMWKKEKINIFALHQWVRRNKINLGCCEKCKSKEIEIGFLDLANISGKYKRDVNDYKWLCRSCHMKEDGRILNLKQYKLIEIKNG